MSVYEKVTVCNECGRTKAYDDQHPARPCPRCGGKLLERVGQFVVSGDNNWWEFWKPTSGSWILKGVE